MKNRLPEKLTALRKNFKFSQADIARQMNVPVNEYMHWENGSAVCRIDQLKQLADFYHVPMVELLDNRREVTMPDPEIMYASVEIPFAKKSDEQKAQDESVEIMPVSGLLEEAEVDLMPVAGVVSETAPAENTRKVTTGTIEMNTLEFEPTLTNRIVDDRQPEAEKPVQENGTGKNRNLLIVVACLLLAAAGIFGIMKMRDKTPADPEEINKLGSVNRLALTDTCSLYIDDSGRLNTMGTVPPLDDYDGVVQISAFDGHLLGLKKDGTVVTNNGLKLDEWEGITMIAAGKTHAAGLKEDGTVVCEGSEAGCDVAGWTDVQAVYAGRDLTLGLTKDGSLLISGKVNAEEQLKTVNSAVDLAVNESQIAVVTKDGRVTCYAIGTGSPFNTAAWTGVEKVALGSDFAVGLSGGKVLTATTDEDLIEAVKNWNGIRMLAGRGRTLVAVNAAGKVIGCGDNTWGVYPETEETADPEDDKEEKLAGVQNVKFNVATGNLSISWDKVPNADFYEITVSTSPVTKLKSAKNSTSISTSKLEDGAEYSVTITACSNNTKKYQNSDAVNVIYTFNAATEQLDAVSGLSADATDDGWHLEWNAVKNAAWYRVRVGDIEKKAETNKLDIAGSELTDGMAYNISVTACPKDGDKKYTESAASSMQKTFAYRTYTVTVHFSGAQSDTFTLNLRKGTYTYKDQFTAKVQEGNQLAAPDSSFTVSSDLEINGVAVEVIPTPEPTPTPTATPTPTSTPEVTETPGETTEPEPTAEGEGHE